MPTNFNFRATLTNYCFLIIILSVFHLNAQEPSNDEYIVDAFENYSEAPRELIFVHLNKSTYINGEMLGFTAYTFDKSSKQRSSLTTNLYCTISDLEGNIIKKKLIQVKDGISSNVFYVDDGLAEGTFIFKAYTNWMLNFEEQNHFQQVFNVLNADKETEIDNSIVDNDIDIQILGEGGHLIYNTLNTAGVIVKNRFGKGLGNARVQILDDTEQVVNEFRLNQFGIAKAFLNPEPDRKYYVKVFRNDTFDITEITNIKANGFNVTINEIKDKFSLQFSTNNSSLAILKDKRFNLAIHNGGDVKVIPFSMVDLKRLLLIPKSELFSGINIFTVFDETNAPILERLVFNDFNVERASATFMSTTPKKDSLLIKLRVDNHVPESFENISISVLPSGTKSYNHQHNILSQIYLQPYIKTPIQNAAYYFKANDRKTKYDLDNLLITQGWSSYDWTTIFNFDNIYKYNFEQGITITSNINGKTKPGIYIAYPLENSSSQLFTITEDDKVFSSKGFVPIDNELFKVGFINNKSEPRAPAIYPQFSPSKFPEFKRLYQYAEPNLSKLTPETIIPKTPSSWSEIEKLDEILLTAKKEKTKLEKLQEKKTRGKIFELDDNERLRGTPLYVYLNQIGFYADYDFQNGIFTITNPRVKWGNPVPLVYLDGALIQENNFEALSILTIESIDYIDVEYYGFGGGIRGQAGYIKIYTTGEFYGRNGGKNNKIAEFEFPLTFDSKKEFYTPKYQFYNTTFFTEYGTIDWKPNLKIDENGILSFKIFNSETEEIDLYINGIVNDNSLLSETIILKVSDSN
ncbi:hypothetical protein [uncultured Psychroserpens sp.]|uniref:hypothetical protein n=1 Tax=uncultured Psychroserpens sp. TaxID=255436 RepID=UPI0026021C73|nr:hypothetical protein [uncultured Psychroserpens sp.]